MSKNTIFGSVNTEFDYEGHKIKSIGSLRFPFDKPDELKIEAKEDDVKITFIEIDGQHIKPQEADDALKKAIRKKTIKPCLKKAEEIKADYLKRQEKK